MKLLAIDSEEIILKSITKALSKWGDGAIEVTITNSAMEGLKIIRNEAYDVVFADVTLAGLNSAELLRRIKQTSPSISVILMSGHLSERSFPGETSMSPNGFLQKPFTTSEIRTTLSSILKERKG